MRIFTTILKWIARAVVGVLAFFGGALFYSIIRSIVTHWNEIEAIQNDNELCDDCKAKTMIAMWAKDTLPL